MKIIQVGAGGWGESWLEKVQRSPSWEVAAIVGRGQPALRAAQETHGIDPNVCFTSLSEASAAVAADAALICIPSPDHLPLATEAFEAGLHVLIEKPLADTMEEAHEVVRRARLADRLLMVAQNYRYRPGAQTVAALLRQGWLGAISSVTIEYRKAPQFVRPPTPHGYTGFRMIEDMTVHHLDQMRGVLQEEPATVYGQARNPEWSWFAYPPIVTSVIEMESGAVVHYFASWVSRGRETSWDGTWVIDCEGGQIEWAHNRVRVKPVEVYYTVELEGFADRDGWMDAQGWMESSFESGKLAGREYILESFAKSIDTGTEPETSGADNLRSLAPAFALADSVRTGQPTAVSDYLVHGQGLGGSES